MAVLRIARMGHPVLKKAAQPVADATAPEIQRLIADMRETLPEAGGIGLAAPQVFVSRRVVVLDVPDDRYESEGDASPEASLPGVLINPVLTPMSEERAVAYEACLSVPGLTGPVPRFTRIGWTALDARGRPISGEAQGFAARVLQHECDHLDGILYPMRMTDVAELGFTEEVRRSLSHAEPETEDA